VKQISKRLMSWASIVEDATLAQADRISRLPFIHPHCALMPDAHLGKGACVGLGLPTKGALVPAAVGVDIGCGMMACRLDVRYDDFRQAGDLWALHRAISRAIPLSAGKYNSHDQQYEWPDTQHRIDELARMPGAGDAGEVAPNWHLQLGSLGSGNHFIELCTDEDGFVWLFLHSGSRGVGNKLAMRHIKIAQKQMEKWWIKLEDPDLAYLVEGTQEFSDYYRCLKWAQRFAFLNREEMMERVKGEVMKWLGVSFLMLTEEVNCHHNYTAKERHFGREVWMSRKGAIDASAGVMGLIPGSMGDMSYVVEGLGNPLSLNTAPHGAGREYSRSKARKEFTRESLDLLMKDVVWGDSDAFLDEHPLAYKRIDVVMEDAADLVRPVHRLRQFVNVKGD
jgi:tRNA-splicing ligase RtcB